MRQGTGYVLLAGALGVLGLTGTTAAQDSKVADELAKYREALADGNPADLLEVKGAALWAEKRGPKNASLEQCDFGLGPGKLDGAYAQLPRYFKDTGKVMDVESRLVHCMVTLQGFKQEDVTRQWFSKPGTESEIEALVTFIGAKSNGMPINVPATHPEEKKMYQIGEYVFYRRSGPQDFSCAICHGQDGKRIRLQELGNLTTKEGDEDLAVLSRFAGGGVDHGASPDRLHAPGALPRTEISLRFHHRPAGVPAEECDGHRDGNAGYQALRG